MVDMDFATQQFAAKRYDVAEFYLKKTLVVLPDNLKALNLLGWSYFFQSRFDKALVAFQRAHSLNSKKPDPLIGMAWSYFSLKYYEKALETFEEAQKLSADSFQIKKGKGFTYLKLVKNQEARREFSRIYNAEEIERLMAFWKKWQGWKPDTMIRTLSADDNTRSVFAWTADKPRYKNLLAGLEPEDHRNQVDAAWEFFLRNAYRKAINAFEHLPVPQFNSLDTRNGLAWSYLGDGKIRT
ncbi:MAG: tetratricopeptide repeat protein, partial [Nitrospinales bacterium]